MAPGARRLVNENGAVIQGLIDFGCRGGHRRTATQRIDTHARKRKVVLGHSDRASVKGMR
jgi:hypothetical protein